VHGYHDLVHSILQHLDPEFLYIYVIVRHMLVSIHPR